MKPEDVKDFIRSVFKMRAWQKAYAERKTTYAKKEAERWENDVDTTLAKAEEYIRSGLNKPEGTEKPGEIPAGEKIFFICI